MSSGEDPLGVDDGAAAGAAEQHGVRVPLVDGRGGVAEQRRDRLLDHLRLGLRRRGQRRRVRGPCVDWLWFLFRRRRNRLN